MTLTVKTHNNIPLTIDDISEGGLFMCNNNLYQRIESSRIRCIWPPLHSSISMATVADFRDSLISRVLSMDLRVTDRKEQ